MKKHCSTIPLLKTVPSDELLQEAVTNVQSRYPTILRGHYQLSDLPTGGLLGTYAYSIPGQIRFILKPDAEIQDGVLPGDISRLWIRRTYRLPQLRRLSQGRSYVLPLLARSGKHRNCAYVDLRGAYRTVLAIAGWDTDYKLGGWLRGTGIPLPRVISETKRCYAMAVSCTASLKSTLFRYNHEGITPTEITNIYANRSLYALASELLNSVASEIVARMPCYYINTDGYIVPSWCANYAIKIANKWGFDARVKHTGNCEVFGYASYKIGEYSTVHNQGVSGNYHVPLISRHERNWLYQIWRRQINRYIM